MTTRFTMVFHGSELVQLTSSDPSLPSKTQAPLVSKSTVTTEVVTVPARQAEWFHRSVSHSFNCKRKD